MATAWLTSVISFTLVLHHMISESHSQFGFEDSSPIYCPSLYQGPVCNASAPYRTAEGYCNNLAYPTWGSFMIPQTRELPAAYEDGIGKPRQTSKNGRPLPGARDISNAVFKVDGKSPRNSRLTIMVMQWGQLIDHELVATPVFKDSNGTKLNCCESENKNESVCFPIQVPDFDPFFKANHCMNLVRSVPASAEHCQSASREQLNKLTSYIDGSMIYGSSQEETMKLRSMSKGQLKTSKHNKLPNRTDASACTLTDNDDFCQAAGDARVNVVPSLGWAHTLFMREHNEIATDLARYNSHWSDETIFQETRRIMAAITQHLNYNEYLPSIMNSEVLEKYDLNPATTLYNTVYNETINAGITNEFAAAAFRFGHSQIPNYQAMMDTQHQMYNTLDIEKTYHTPYFLVNDRFDAFNGIARWLCEDTCPLADGLFESGTRDKLFPDKNGNTFDLPAINIQRGREHGVSSYNHWRELCGLEKGEMLADGGFFLPDHTLVESLKLNSVYSHVDDIDLFAGAMTETLLHNSSVGPTFACLLGRQFNRLKVGDRFWYESEDPVVRFTPVQLNEIKKVTLAKIICETHEIGYIQQNVFFKIGPGNEKVWCKDIPGINLRAWISCKQTTTSGRPEYDLRKCTPYFRVVARASGSRTIQNTLTTCFLLCVAFVFKHVYIL